MNKNGPLISDPTKEAVHYGFVAQDFMKVLPDLVTEIPAELADPRLKGSAEPQKKETRYSLEYESVISPLVKAVQELKSLFDGDHAEVLRLKADNDNRSAALKALEAEFRAYKAAHP